MRASDISPATHLTDLYRAGQLPERYPLVRQLLAELPENELLRAGQLLSRIDPKAVQTRHPGTPAIRIAITGHATVAAVIPALTAQLARHGLLLHSQVGDFGGYVRELGDPGSALYAGKPDIIACLLDPYLIFDEAPLPWGVLDIERILAAKLDLLDVLAGRHAEVGHGVLVLNTLPLPRRFPAQLIDHRSRARLGAAWHDANARLLRLAERYPGTVVLDLAPTLAEGVPAVDDQLSAYARCHLSPSLLAHYARDVGHLARHLTGRTGKCLVIDLDQTLWGGILGEDGADGIELGHTYRGEAFQAFQRIIKQLCSQGVLVAAVSKNDPEPVRAVLRDHPDMVLRDDDFVRVIANWSPKQDNIAGLAVALNLSLDAFVFVDDNPAECGMARRALPEVMVVPVDGEPALHPARLLRDGWFDTLDLTGEDRSRATRYREELDRTDFRGGFSSVEDYLRELDVQVTLRRMAEAEVPRVAQLTLRTNRFNLTTERLQATDVATLTQRPGVLLLTVHSRDRFGDNGLVGAILAQRDGDSIHLDNFLLSCRVFGRGIEQACLASVLRYAQQSGARTVTADYRPTAKNGKVRDLYPRYGFVPEPGNDDGRLSFRHDLTDLPAVPDHVHLTDELGAPRP